MTAVSLVGMANTLALFACGEAGVIIDTAPAVPEVMEHKPVQDLLTRFNWVPAYPGTVPLAVHQSAAAALGSGVEVIRPARPVPPRERTYAVPKAVQAAARQGLASKVEADGLSISTAEQLCSGKPVTLAKVRQIAGVLAIANTSLATRQLWGGRPGRRWADGVLARAGLGPARRGTVLTAAGPPIEADDGSDDGELIEIPEGATPEEITALMKDGATKVDPAEMFSDIREDSHAFVPTPDDPTSCIYCGSPPDYVIHYLPNRFKQTADQAHWFEFNPDDDNCAVCGNPVDDPIHSLTTQASDADGSAAEDPLVPETGPGPGPGPLSASYRPSDLIDASPVILAAVLAAEQDDDRLCYYARFAPGSSEQVDAILMQNEGDGTWTCWDPATNAWVRIDTPDGAIQLMDEASAYTIADQLSVFPQVSLRSLDLDERALFEAALDSGLDDEMEQIEAASYHAVAPDDDEVQYIAVRDPSDTSAVSQLLAQVNTACYTWDFISHQWEQFDCAKQPTGNSSPISFDDAMLVARLQSRDGVATMPPGPLDSDLDQAATELEETKFFNLFSGTMLPPPEHGFTEDDDPYLDALTEELFSFEINPENPTQITALHVQLPNDEWMRWDPDQVTWTPSSMPESGAMTTPREAVEFAAWQYDQAHGGQGGISSMADAETLLSTIQSVEFSSSFSRVLGLLARPEPLDSAERRPEIYFDDRNAIQIHDVPVVADGEPAAPTDSDGYTAEERSKNAQKQVRDKFGRFATGQARVALPKGNKGTIRKIDPERQTVEVAGDDGHIYDLPADQVEVLDEPAPAPDPGKPAPAERQRIDVSQIEAQPRATARTPKGFLPYTLPPMSKEALNDVVNGYQKFIDQERAAEEKKRRAKEKLGRGADEPRD